MAYGQRDYTRSTKVKLISAMIEFDLPVILNDRFGSANMLWNASGLPADYDAALEAGAAYEGDTGLALRTSAAAAGDTEYVEVSRYAFTTPSKKLAFSALFRINQPYSDTKVLTFRMHGRYDNREYNAAIRYSAADRAWQAQNTALGWDNIMTDIQQDEGAWNRVYFEIDMENDQYLSFETADRIVDLHGMQIWINAVPGNERLIGQIYLENEAAGTRADVSIDDVIIKELGA